MKAEEKKIFEIIFTINSVDHMLTRPLITTTQELSNPKLNWDLSLVLANSNFWVHKLNQLKKDMVILIALSDQITQISKNT